jgi:hypothetical protein
MTDLDPDEAVLAGLAERIERGGLMDLSDWRSVILALMRDREGLRARNAEVAYLREQRDKALARVRELEREQRVKKELPTGTDTIQPGTLRYPDDVDPSKLTP